MDTKDPVWDDDDSALSGEGFRPRPQPPNPKQAADSTPEPVSEHVEEQASYEAVTEHPDVPAEAPEPEPSASEASEPAPTPEHAPEPATEPAPIPVPGADRVRIEPVDSFRKAEAGGSRAARDRRQRSSASMVIIALILFLISVISISVYFFSRPAESGVQGETNQVEFIDQGQSAPVESTQPPASSQQETTTPAPEQPSAEQAPPPPPPGATMKSAVAAASSSSGGSGREQTPKDLAESRAPRVEPEPEPAPKAKPEPAPKVKPEAAPKVKPEPTPKPEPRAPSKESAREQSPSRNSAPVPNASLKTSKSASSAGAQWVIQVHSSPSVDDADEWLRQLQSRNVGDGRIEPVTQQGKVWYRVRFGRYATREEAELAALQLGYRNAWIDRVR